MSLRDAYVAKLEAQLKDFGAQLSQLKAKAEKSVAQGRIDYSEKLKSSQSQYDQVNQKLNELKQAGDSHWEALKAGLEGTWNEFKTSIDSIKS
jgi:uncharacterized coiled-coil DUF342 family protein